MRAVSVDHMGKQGLKASLEVNVLVETKLPSSAGPRWRDMVRAEVFHFIA